MSKEEFISKLKAKYEEVKQKLFSKFKKDYSNKDENIDQYEPTPLSAKKPTKNQNIILLIGLSIGFIFGAVISSVILYFKIKNLTEQYNKMQQRVNILSSRMSNMPKQQQNSNIPSNKLNLKSIMPTPDEIINTLPSSNAFASFYIEKLNKAKQQKFSSKLSQEPVQSQLPSLSQLIKNPPANSKKTSTIQPMPPIPDISMIICSNGCYAISPSGQVYTNGYQEGEYKLIVNQNQVYWAKTK